MDFMETMFTRTIIPNTGVKDMFPPIIPHRLIGMFPVCMGV